MCPHAKPVVFAIAFFAVLYPIAQMVGILPTNVYHSGIGGFGKYITWGFAVGLVDEIVDFAKPVVAEQGGLRDAVPRKGPDLPTIGLALQQLYVGRAVQQGGRKGGSLS